MARITAFFKKYFPLLAFAMVVSNFVLSCSAIRSIRPQKVIHYSEVTNYVYSVSSNILTSTFSPTNTTSSSSVVPPVEHPAEYDYFVNAGSPCIRIYGKIVFEGDVVSYGRIFRIFPDRLFLMNGDIIVNSKFAGGRSRDDLRQKKEVK